MQGQDAEPLPTRLWLREMMALADDCAGKPLMAEDQAMRRAYYLCYLCPPALRSLLAPKFSERDLEALLAEDAFEQAAALILGDHGERSLSPRGTPPLFQARYGLGDGTYATLDASLPGLAMIGAWARFFSELQKP